MSINIFVGGDKFAYEFPVASVGEAEYFFKFLTNELKPNRYIRLTIGNDVYEYQSGQGGEFPIAKGEKCHR